MSHQVATGSKEMHQKEQKQATYCQVVNYLSGTYATDDVFLETTDDITNFKQPVGMTDAPYSKAVYEKVLKCSNVCNEAGLSGIFTEGLHSSIHYSTRTNWRADRDANLHRLTRHATLLVRLREYTRIAASSI